MSCVRASHVLNWYTFHNMCCVWRCTQIRYTTLQPASQHIQKKPYPNERNSKISRGWNQYYGCKICLHMQHWRFTVWIWFVWYWFVRHENVCFISSRSFSLILCLLHRHSHQYYQLAFLPEIFLCSVVGSHCLCLCVCVSVMVYSLLFDFGPANTMTRTDIPYCFVSVCLWVCVCVCSYVHVATVRIYMKE